MTPGERRLNWVWYLNAALGVERDRVLNDKDGRRRKFSVPKGFGSPYWANWLHDQVHRILPSSFLRLVEATTELFVQTILDLALPTMAFGRVCLTGDAAFVPRLRTAARTAKAAEDPLALADCMTAANGDTVEAPQGSELAQLDYVERLRTHGQRLGNRSQFNGTLTKEDDDHGEFEGQGGNRNRGRIRHRQGDGSGDGEGRGRRRHWQP